MLFASLATLIAFLYAGGEWLSLAGGFGFPTDAAWVRAVFARSVGLLHGLTFTSSAPVAGAAAPSWILALAIAGAPSGNFVIAAKVLGVLSVILSAFLAWGIAFRLLGDWRFAFLAGLLVASSPLLSAQALSGTEGAFAGMLVLAAIYWQGRGWEGTRGSRVLGALALGFAALARPELLLLLPLALVDRWIAAGLHGRIGQRALSAVTRAFPEVIGAGLVMLPYILYCLHAGGPAWQQPELSLRAQPVLAWPKLVLLSLWASNPVMLMLAAAGLFVVCLAAARERADDPTFLPALIPVAVLLVPGFLWHYLEPQNAVYAAASLAPLCCILGAAGLFLLYRLARGLTQQARLRATRVVFGVVVAAMLGLLFGLPVQQHRVAWNEHREAVLRIDRLQVCAGKWAAQHLSSDSSIAAREVGALGFFSNRRVIDLGGSISAEGIRALRKSGSPDADLLTYLQKTQPSHLAIRPSDFPDLAKRPDLLSQDVTCLYTNKDTNATSTLVLYETIWLAPSMRLAARLSRESEESHGGRRDREHR